MLLGPPQEKLKYIKIAGLRVFNCLDKEYKILPDGLYYNQKV